VIAYLLHLHLDQLTNDLPAPNLLIANPTHHRIHPDPRRPQRLLGHTEVTLAYLSLHPQPQHITIAPTLLTKHRSTPRSGIHGATLETKTAAATAHTAAIEFQHPVTDQHLIIYDDYATTLTTLDALARQAKTLGAATVTGLVFGRSAYRGRPTT